MGRQVKHLRHSKYGRPFWAGSLPSREVKEKEISILDSYEDYQPSDAEVEEIVKQTGIEDKEVIKNLLVENDGDVSEVIEQLEEEPSEEVTEDERDEVDEDQEED